MRLTESGLGSRPTLVNNVETLGHIALISRFGGDWFRSIGTVTDPAARLITVGSDGKPSIVLEIAGEPARRRAAFYRHRPCLAVRRPGRRLPRAWLPVSALEVRLDRQGLSVFGASPGAGILMGLDARHCPLTVAAEIATYLAGESAGRCGPCVNGLPAMAAVLGRLARGDRDLAPAAEVRRLAELVTGRGSCNHAESTARFVLSTLTVFTESVDAHQTGRCRKDHS